ADVAASLSISPTRDGRFQAGLMVAWELVMQRVGGAPGAFFSSEREALLGHLQRRNRSILAHGFAPVGHSEWESLNSWLEKAFLPMLGAELAAGGVGTKFPQLPQRYPFADLKMQ